MGRKIAGKIPGEYHLRTKDLAALGLPALEGWRLYVIDQRVSSQGNKFVNTKLVADAPRKGTANLWLTWSPESSTIPSFSWYRTREALELSDADKLLLEDIIAAVWNRGSAEIPVGVSGRSKGPKGGAKLAEYKRLVAQHVKEKEELASKLEAAELEIISLKQRVTELLDKDPLFN